MNSEIRHSDYEIKLPFRISIIGPMNSGKSSWIYQFILKFKDITNILKIKRHLEIIFCHNSVSSLQGMKEAAMESNIVTKFQHIAYLPKPIDINNYIESKENTEFVMIMEDLQDQFRSMGKDLLRDWGK